MTILSSLFDLANKLSKRLFGKELVYYSEIRPTTSFIKKHMDGELVGVEIGVFKGENALNILKNLKVKKLYLIDPFDRLPTKLKNSDRVVFIKKKGEDAGNDIPDKLDFVYVDSDHLYESTKRELKVFYPKIRKGGVIGGHDFRSKYLGVCQAVFELVEEHNLDLSGGDLDWWVVKK